MRPVHHAMQGGGLLADRMAGVLLGTALGDALGLPCEGMSPDRIRRRFGDLEGFGLCGSTGFVSDDTEQSALVAQSLLRARGAIDEAERRFGWSLVGWFLRLPWGIGFATLRACLKRLIGVRPSGVFSAGNGAAMRAAVIGVYFSGDEAARRACGRKMAEVTHRDARGVEGALFVAELAALASRSAPDADRRELFAQARMVVRDPILGAALDESRSMLSWGATTEQAAAKLGTTGYVVHTVAFAAFCFLADGFEPMTAIRQTIWAGGDTDSIAAIVGAWMGALHGESGLPADLLAKLHDGPFGPTHLRALARGLVDLLEGRMPVVPDYSASGALARNLALYPVIIAHVLRRLIP